MFVYCFGSLRSNEIADTVYKNVLIFNTPFNKITIDFCLVHTQKHSKAALLFSRSMCMPICSERTRARLLILKSTRNCSILYTVTGHRHKQCYNCCDDSFRNINTILYTFFVVAVVGTFISPFDFWPFHFLIYYHLSMIIFCLNQKKNPKIYDQRWLWRYTLIVLR